MSAAAIVTGRMPRLRRRPVRRRRLVAGRCRLLGALGLALLGLEPGEAALPLGGEEQPGPGAVGGREPHGDEEREEDEPGAGPRRAPLSDSSAAKRTPSLEKNPTSGGTPGERRRGRRPRDQYSAPGPRARPRRATKAVPPASTDSQPTARKSSDLKKAWREEVREGRRRARLGRGRGERAGHDRDLAEGGVGEHPLEVGLGEREQGGPDHGHARRARRGAMRAASSTAKSGKRRAMT